MKIIILNALDVSGQEIDLAVENGIISELYHSDNINTLKKEVSVDKSIRVIDAKGMVILPGLADMHTHLREPGGEQSETVLSGSQAAAAGGFTTVLAMANTTPVADNAGVVTQVYQLGKKAGYVRVQPIGAVTIDLAGKNLSEIGAMADSEAKVRVFSDDGKCVSDSLLMRRALEYVKTFDGVVAQHAQDPQLTIGAQMNEGRISENLGLTGWPAIAEESVIARDIMLADYVGAKLHICHLSTSGSVDIVRNAKKKGSKVTAEVTPHHLLLTEEKAISYDARYKVNPPLRREEDVLALRHALAEGVIDIVATDHAPHPVETKNCTWSEAAFGMVGLESALSILNTTMLKTGLINWSDAANILSHKPLAIAGLSDPGAITLNREASFTLFDPNEEYYFDLPNLYGKSNNSPYLGEKLYGRVKYTFYRGYMTFDNEEIVAADIVAEAAFEADNKI